jgi:hypothetical protein
MKAGKLVQCAGRHDDLAAMVDVLSFGSWHHCNRVTTVVFIEAATCTAWAHQATHYALHRIVHEVRSELELLGGAQRVQWGEMKLQIQTYHDGSSRRILANK